MAMQLGVTYITGKTIYCVVYAVGAQTAYSVADGGFASVTAEIDPYDPYDMGCPDRADFAIDLYDECSSGLYVGSVSPARSGLLWVVAYRADGDTPSQDDEPIGCCVVDYNHVTGEEVVLSNTNTQTQQALAAIFRKTGDGYTERDRRRDRGVAQRKSNNRRT